jgi:uncharacterized protein
VSRFAPLSSWFRFPSALIVAFALTAALARASEVIPPAPAHYFNDYAGAVSSGTAADLDAQLTQFERDSSNQIVVAIYPQMQSDSSIEDYTVRVAQSWGVGQKGRNNGAVLFVFINDRKTYIQVGYGLEGALPDATCHLIIENEIKPYFRAGNYDDGLRAAITAIIQATRGEYKGTGQTVGDSISQNHALVFRLALFAALIAFSIWSSRRRGRLYGSSGSSMVWFGGFGGGGGFGGRGGGGGFSGGGGSFGGGGSGGSW